MLCRNQSAKINVKLLVILILVTAAVGVSLVAARQARRAILSEKALAEGRAAFEKKDWPVAVKRLREYLGRNPDDPEILRKYAEALMSTRPLDSRAVAGAISAYRRLLQLDPSDQVVSEKLAMLYGSGGIGNFEGLASLARTRLERDPNDRKASLWLADALSRLNKKVEARQVLEAFIQRLEVLPGKHGEYVRACVQMGGLTAGLNVVPRETAPASGTPTQPPAGAGIGDVTPPPTPLDWLNKAVTYAPDSGEALVSRARFHLQAAGAVDVNETKQAALLALARQDLLAADTLGTRDPLVLYSLASTWIQAGDLDRAAADLRVADTLSADAVAGQFLDITEWNVTKYLLAWQVAMRKGAVTEAAALTDRILASFDEKQKRYRGLVLPSAVQAYVIVGRPADAKRCLDEYLALVQDRQIQTPSARAIAAMKALVEAAQNRPYGVIDLLEPVVGNDPNSPQVLRLLADAYSRTGQAGRAVKVLEQYRRLNPQDQQATRELARQYARMGDFEKGLDLAREVESLNPADISVKLLRIGAEISRVIGRGPRAGASDLTALSAELAGLRQQQPDRVDIRILQAIIPAFLNRPEEAERELKQAIAECKEPLRAEIQLMRHYVSAGRVDDALEVCRKACERHKELAEPWLALADLQAMKQDYDSARRSLRQGQETISDGRARRSLATKLALLELAHGDPPTGIGLLKELAHDPQEIQARLLLLGRNEIWKDPNTADRLIAELRTAEGQNGLWWRLYQASRWLSDDNWASKQQDIANLLQYCVDADPTWPAPVLTLAAMYERQKDLKRVEDVYRQGLLGNPSATEIADRLLRLLVGQKRFADAETVLRQIQNPRVVTNWQVSLAIGAGDFSRAIDELRLRISNDRQDAASRVELARLLYQETKDNAQALRYLDEAKAINPSSSTLAAVRASILRTEGKPAEALRVLDDYVADYNNFDAYWMRAVYLTEGRDLKRAEQDYRRLTTFKDGAAAGYELLGNFLANTGKLDQAVTAVKEGLGAYPEELRLKRGLMRLLLSRDLPGDKEEALGILRDLEKQLPGDSELMMARAVEKMREGTPPSMAEAKGILENILKREPTAIDARLYLIGIAMQERQYQAACDAAIRALELNPDNPALLLARARAEMALGYAPMAARLARRVLQQDPNSVEASYVFAQAAVSGDDSSIQEEARKLVDDAVRRNPANERLLLLRGEVFTALQQPEKAIPELEAYCQTKPGADSIAALVTLADLYRLANNAERSRQWIDQAQRVDPDSQVVLHARVLWLAWQEQLDELKTAITTCLSVQEQDVSMLLHTASVLASSDSVELKKQGVRLLERAAALSPTAVNVQLSLASTLYQAGDVDRAGKLYEELLQQHPDDKRILNDLAWILQERDHSYETALELTNRGIKLAPDDLNLLDTRGTILANLPERLADAKIDFGKLVELSPPDTQRRAKALLQLARVCAKLKDLPQAKEHLQEALKIDEKLHIFTPAERAEIAGVLSKAEI